MVCPVCRHQMIKTTVKAANSAANAIKCVSCDFVVYYKGVKAA